MRGLPITASLGASVRSRRFRLGISQEELAERAGLHRTYIAGIEGGRRNITLKSIQKLAQALETSVGALLAESDNSLRKDIPSLLLVENDPRGLELTLEAFPMTRFRQRLCLGPEIPIKGRRSRISSTANSAEAAWLSKES